LLLRTSPDRDWFALSGTARRIWELLEYPATRSALVASLGSEYDAAPEAIGQAVDETIAILRREGFVEAVAGTGQDPLRDRYLALLKRAVANLLYPELELAVSFLSKGRRGLAGVELQRALRDIRTREPDAYESLIAAKTHGWTLPHAHTMVGLFRLANLERCAERIFEDGIEGDFLEAGVCRGGAAIFMRGLQLAHGEGARKLWVVDSFEGVPPPVAEEDRPYDVHLEEERQPWIACDLQSVREHFRRYDMLSPEVRFLPGWVEDTLPTAPIGPLALLRLDVDLYSATAKCLDALYDRLVPGGFVVVDDYGSLRCCRDAVDSFRERRGISEPIHSIDATGVYWRRESGDPA
jgi:O-methyltransferase